MLKGDIFQNEMRKPHTPAFHIPCVGFTHHISEPMPRLEHFLNILIQAKLNLFFYMKLFNRPPLVFGWFNLVIRFLVLYGLNLHTYNSC